MRNRNIFIFYLVSIFVLISCGKDRTEEYIEQTQENQWIYNTMKEVYLWKEDIKELQQAEFFNSQEKFFSSLLHKDDKASFMTETLAINDYGMSIATMRDPIAEKPSQVYALVLFVEPNSPAAVAGIRRGMWISAINGKSLTTSSQSELEKGDAIALTTEYIEFDNEENKHFWVQGETINVAASTAYEICNIGFDNIYTVRDKKIGYMLCNNFNGDNFIEKANGVMEKFIASDVSDIIIDLRYNTGGKISNAALLASMLVPSDLNGTPFCTLKDNTETVDTIYNYTEQQFCAGEKKIHFITGEATKGTAELLVHSVNASRDMYDVFVIGAKSSGVNIMIEEFESPYGFSISPATAITYISNGEKMTADGIKPDYAYDELKNKNSIYPLGDEQEYLLYNTCYIIATGTAPSLSNHVTGYTISTPNRTSFIR